MELRKGTQIKFPGRWALLGRPPDLERVSAMTTHLGFRQTPSGWESTPAARGHSSLGNVTGLIKFLGIRVQRPKGKGLWPQSPGAAMLAGLR